MILCVFFSYIFRSFTFSYYLVGIFFGGVLGARPNFAAGIFA